LPRPCQIRAEGGRALARGLAANATLAHLELQWNGLGSGGGAALGEALALNMGLRHLDMSHCRIEAEGCLLIAAGLKVGTGWSELGEGWAGFAHVAVQYLLAFAHTMCNSVPSA
jgi:hypothetical protein